MYILLCTCGNANIEKLDGKNMFLCHNCGEKLHKTELVITTLKECFKKEVEKNME